MSSRGASTARNNAEFGSLREELVAHNCTRGVFTFFYFDILFRRWPSFDRGADVVGPEPPGVSDEFLATVPASARQPLKSRVHSCIAKSLRAVDTPILRRCELTLLTPASVGLSLRRRTHRSWGGGLDHLRPSQVRHMLERTARSLGLSGTLFLTLWGRQAIVTDGEHRCK